MATERGDVQASEPGDDLRARLVELERRVAALETERLASPPMLDATPSTPVHTLETVFAEARATRSADLESRTHTPDTSSALADIDESQSKIPLVIAEQSGTEKSISLEQIIGGRWYAVLGALAVTVGIGLFVKLAYDEGWLQVPPVWRCIAGVAFGLALIGVAEWVRRRFGTWAALGSYSAGLGAVYVSAYLAYRLYALMDPLTAFAGLGLVAVGGLAVSVRARLQAVGVASLAGGYIAPFLISSAPDKPLALPTYLLTLQCVGIGLVAWRRGEFRVVRQVVTSMTMLIGLFWLLNRGWHLDWWPQAFLAAVWCITNAELAWTTARTPPRTTSRGWYRRAGVSVLASVGVTVWWVGIGVVHAQETSLFEPWFVPLAACAATLLLSLLVSGSGLLIDRHSTSSRDALGQSFAMLSAAALALTIALGLKGPIEVLAWLVLGTAGVLIARRIDSFSTRLYGAALLIIGTARLCVYDWQTTMHAAGFAIAGLELTTWSLMMMLASAAWLIVVQTWRSAGNAPTLGRNFAAAAALVPFFASVLHPSVDVTTVAWVWAGMIVVLAACRGTAAAPLDSASTLLAVFPLIAWQVRVMQSSQKELLLPYNASTALQGLAVGGVTILVAALARWKRGPENLYVTSAVAGAIVAFAASCLGVATIAMSVSDDLLARRAAISLWWGVCAAALLVAGFARSNAPARHVALGLLGAAAIKVVVFDLAEVSAAWRIASFLVLGLLMLGVALAYGRIMSKLRHTSQHTQ